MRKLAILTALLLSGCDYSLRIPYPKVEKVDRGTSFQSMVASSSVQPSTPTFGETVTVTLMGLDAKYYHSLYLSYGDVSGGDPDKPSKEKYAPYYKLGNLVPVNDVATISFDLRPVMGNDQNGDPFKLSRGQLVTLTIKSQRIDKPEFYGMYGGGPYSFLIQ